VDVRDQFHAPTASLPVKDIPVPIEEGDWWALQSPWTLDKRESSSPRQEIEPQFLGRLVCSLDTKGWIGRHCSSLVLYYVSQMAVVLRPTG
jgi:hypothetical protein